MGKLAPLLCALAVLGAVPAAEARQPASLVRVQTPDLEAVALLQRLGLDVTESSAPGATHVVLHHLEDHAVLRATGYSFEVRVPDIAARHAANRAADRRWARALRGPSTLPSGQAQYRTYDEYDTELADLAAANPGLVRLLDLPEASVDGAPIRAVEIATDVERTDDGRPVFMVMGMHHSREWPSAEVTIEFAYTLVGEYGTARVRSLLDRVRVVVIPVVNPDGFRTSLDPGPGGEPLRRKNCADDQSPAPALCRDRDGVDLNRNYGAYWGGAGSGGAWTDSDFRGPAPFSEPEARAVHALSSRLQVVTLITNHTVSAGGLILRQPGFTAQGTAMPDEARMKALGDSMAGATGYTSAKAYTLGQITGATEDWNYFAQGTFGYTTELREANDDFHGPYATAVVGEYAGLREAFLRAGEQAADATDHSVIEGSAPAGSTLRVRKTFTTPTSPQNGTPMQLPETLESTITVPGSGRFEWHVNPSTRPLSPPRSESWTLTCESPPGTVLQTQRVTVGRGERVSLTPCSAPVAPPGPPPPAPPAGPPPPGGAARIVARPLRLSARRVNARRRFAVTVEARGGGLRLLRARLTRRGRTAARGSLSTLETRGRLLLRLRARLRPGIYRLTLTATAPDGRVVRLAVRVRVTR